MPHKYPEYPELMGYIPFYIYIYKHIIYVHIYVYTHIYHVLIIEGKYASDPDRWKMEGQTYWFPVDSPVDQSIDSRSNQLVFCLIGSPSIYNVLSPTKQVLSR